MSHPKLHSCTFKINIVCFKMLDVQYHVNVADLKHAFCFSLHQHPNYCTYMNYICVFDVCVYIYIYICMWVYNMCVLCMLEFCVLGR